MIPHPSFSIERLRCRIRELLACFATVLLLVSPGSAPGLDVYWDADGDGNGNRFDGSGLGGSGIWDSSLFRWWDGAGYAGAWPDLGPDSPLRAYFLGTSGTVTLGGTFVTGGLTLDASSGGGYHLAGGTLSLDSDFGDPAVRKMGLSTDLIGSTIDLVDTAVFDLADGSLVLGGLLSGPGGFTKEGTGTLVLAGSAANTYTGVTTLNNGITLARMQGNTLNALGATGAAQNTVVNAGATFATGNDLDNATPGSQTTGGYGTVSEPFTINGDGYLGQGSLRKMMGREQDTLGGAITMGGAARIQADFGTLQLSGAVGATSTLTASGAAGFVSLGGVVSGSADIVHYGISGFRMQNNGNTYTGTIRSTLGEIRADTGNTTTGDNPYDTIAALDMRNSALRLNFPNAGGTAPNVANSRFSATAPVSMRSSQIYVDNASFSSTSSTFFDYAVAQAFGVTTLTGGGNKITTRSADTGSVTLTFADFARPNPGTTLELQIDNLVGGATAEWGASAKHSIVNSALEAGPTAVSLIPWGFYGAEFLEYDPVALGGFGYSKLDAGDYTLNTAEGTWAAGQNIKVDGGNATLTGNRSIQSLNIQGGTDRTVGGNAGTVLEVTHGGMLFRDDGHTLSVPFVTAGAGSDYELHDIAWSFHTIRSVIQDNAGNPVSLTKAGGNTTRFLGNNTYTGTTYLVEGMFQDIVGARNQTALGGGNLHMIGDADSQGVYENDSDFTRALGTGAGQVQLTGGGGFGSGSVGFGAYGAPIDLNFGGAGASVTWGSATFNPGIFTLNGGNATHVLTLVNDLDLGGEQRYLRLDGNASGGNRAVLGTISGAVANGGVVRRGGGVLFFDDAKTYAGSTILFEGELWLRNGTGMAGANVTGNDIQIYQGARLKLDDPASVGSRQMIILENNGDDTPAAIAFGPGYGDGGGLRFHSIIGALGAAVPQAGAYDITLANQQTGNDRRNRVAIQISDNHGFSTDVLAQVKAVAPDVQAWFGADTGNGTYTGTALTATGRTKSNTAFSYEGFFLGSGGGTLTIANGDVLQGAFPLTVGAIDNTFRTNIGGVVYLPKAQNYTGTVTQTAGTALTAGNLIGSGGVLVVGNDGALNAGNGNISLRSGELSLGIDPANGFSGQTDAQYTARNLFVKGGTGTLRTIPLGGGSFGTVTLNDFTMRMDNSDRVFNLLTIGTHYTETRFNGGAVLENSSTARSAYFDVGSDNSYQSGIGVLSFNGVVSQTGSGAVNLHKRNGGALILANDNTFTGSTNLQQGRLVLAHTGAAGNAGSTVSLNTTVATGGRRSDLEFRVDGAGPFFFDNVVATTGGDDSSTRVLTAGSMNGASANQVVQIPILTIGHSGTFGLDSAVSSSVYFDGFNGYQLDVTGTLNLNRDINLRTRGAKVTVSGIVAGAAGNDLNKQEQGTLVLSGNNTYLGATYVSNGYLVLGHDNALGGAASNVTLRSTSFSQVLAGGVRTIGRNFENTATGSTQTLGGLDAGAKTFSGNVLLTSRGVALTSVTGGDTTFTSTISGAGAGGIIKTGTGTVLLDPTSGTGNTFTSGVTISQGTLVGEAQATSGSPFGVDNAFTIANGALRLNNNTGALNATATAGALTINTGNAALQVNDAGGFGTTLTFGSLARSNAATLTLQGITTDLGTAGNEKVAFTAAPGLTNGTIGTWAAIQGLGSNAAHYAGVSGSNLVTATYGGTGDLDLAGGAAELFDAGATGGTLTANRSVYAFRSNANVALGGFTLNLGSAGQAGMILNAGADVSGGTVAFGGNVLSVYADAAATSAIGAPLTNYRNNANNTLATSLVKFGPGTLELSGANTFQGNVQVNQGTLSLTAANVMPTFGNLNAVTGSTVVIQPGATVLLNNNDQEFGNLSGTSVVSPVLNTAGTLDLGAATLTMGRQGSSTTFSGRIVGGTGSQITKIGGGRLTLDNWDAAMPNSLGTLDIAQGVVQARLNDQSWATPAGFASSIPSATGILLRGGEWEAYVAGDNTSNFQIIPLGNSIVHQGGNSALDTNRWQGGAANKILLFDDLTLDKQNFLTTGGNGIYPRFDGAITLTSNSRIQTDAPLLLNGPIAGNFTLTKTGGSNLEIGGDNSAWSGGTVATDGTILFGGRYPEDAVRYMAGSNLFAYSATANLGTGDVVINRNTSIRINAPTNVLTGSGQRVQVFGSLTNSLPRVDIGRDDPLTDYGLRALGNGTLNLGLNDGFHTHTIDQAMLGNGKWGVGAWTTTFYTAATMGAGSDNVYRFLGTNAVLGITQADALSGDASLWVGAPQYDQGFALGNTSAQVRLYGDQSYTGNTTVFRSDNTGNTNNFLSILGDSSSPVFDVYGRLEARGDGRFTDDAGNQVNTINLHPGSHLRLDYSMDVNDTMLISRLDNSNLGLESDENKWGDTTPMTLRGATLNLVNSGGRQNRERLGAMTVEQGAAVYLERNSTNGQIVLSTPSVTRSGQATFAVRLNANELGRVDLQGQKFFIDNGATMLDAQGLLPVWMTSPTYNSFLTYHSDFGVQLAPFTTTASGTGTGAAFLAGLIATDVASYGTGIGDATLAGSADVWALRISHDASGNDTTLTGGQINIRSGGLIVDNRDNARVDFDTTAVYFGDGSNPVEGLVFTDQSNQTLRLGGVVTADDFTMHGAGNVQLTNAANAIVGNIQMNSGKLFLDGAGSAGTASITLAGDWLQNNDGQQMAELWLRGPNASVTWNAGNGISVAENVPYVRILGANFSGATLNATRTHTIPSLNILGTSTLQGTSLVIGTTSNTDNANNYNLSVSGATTLGGTAPIGFRIERGGTNIQGGSGLLTLAGAVTGSAPVVKSGDGYLVLQGNNTGLTGPVTLNRGVIRGQGNNTNNFFGTGDYTLNFGQLDIYHNNTGTYFNAAGQDIAVAGAVTINSNRNGGSNAANYTIGVNNGSNTIRTLNGANLRLNAASFGDDYYIESKVIVNDSASWFQDNTEVWLRDQLVGGGRFTRTGIWYTYFDNNAANADWHGTIDLQAGTVRMLQSGATLGGAGSSVIVHPSAALTIRTVGNLGTGAGISQLRATSATNLPVLGMGLASDFAAVLAHYDSLAPIGARNGVLALDAGQTMSFDPGMAAFQNGNWFLGSNSGGTLSASSLAPWGAGGDRFLLGGGSSTLTLQPATAGSAQLAGAGNRVILGSPNNLFGYGAVTFGANGNNTYGGGTLVSRARNMDNGYRGVVLSLQGGAVGTGATFRAPLGGGTVDVFGEARIEGASGTAVTTGGAANANTWVLHPASRLRFDNNTPFTGSGTTGNRASGTLGGGGRWADTVGITLDGAVLELFGDNTDHIANREVVGDLTISRGAEVVIRRDTGDWVELSAGDLIRSGSGTLQIAGMVGSTNTANMLGTVASNVDSALFLASNGLSLMNNGMVDPWIVSRFDNNFVKYDGALGFRAITQGGAPANYLTVAGGTIDGADLPLNNGTEILNLTTGTGTLGANLNIHALRTDRDINVSADGAFQNIVIRSGGLVQAANTPTINADLYFGSSGLGDGEALIHASNNTLQINGKIHASEVVKFGSALLSVRSDQPQFTGDWVVNGGGLQFLTPGAASTGEVVLNGSRMNDRDNTLNLTEVRYTFNSGTPDLFTFTGGKITAYDVNRVYTPTASDRLVQIPDIDLRTTNSVPGTGQEGTLFFQVDSYRSTARTGTVTLYDHYLVHAESGSFGTGSTTGVQFGAGDGTGGLNNQGLYDLRKVGDGVLTLGDNTASFTGGRSITVGEGALRVLHNGAFGGAGNSGNIEQGGVLEIAVAGWSPTATLNMQPGAMERWAVDGARGGVSHSLPAGVHLQVMNNQTGIQTINLDGGSIMGYLPRDWEQVAVIHTLGSGITIHLDSDSFLGQPYASSNNQIWDVGRIYDIGKINQTTGPNPNDVALRGSYLQIDGAITGAGGLTKVGQDMILLNGASTYAGATVVENGVLQIGRNNALPTTTSLVMETASGIFDLNGYDQEVGALSGDNGSIANGAFAVNNLTVDQSGNTVFAGSIDGSVSLVKDGVGTLELMGVNTHRGSTVVSGGILRLNGAAGANAAIPTDGREATEDDVVVSGGTLQIAASEQIENNAAIAMASGFFNFGSASGLTETIGKLTNTGGDFSTGDNTLVGTGGSIAFAGGTNTVSAGGLVQDSHVLVTGGSNIVEGGASGGVLHVQPGGEGLEFGGTGDPSLTLESDDAMPGRLLLEADLTVLDTLVSGTAAILSSGTGANPGRVDLGGATRTFTVADGAAATDLHVSAQIANGGLVKAGAGTLHLSGANTYEGGTVVQAGFLSIASEGNLGANPGAPTPGHLSLDGGGLRANASVTLDDPNRGIALSGNGGAFDVAPGAVLTVSNVISGDAGDLVKTGAGTLELTAANTYSETGHGPEVNHGTFLDSGTLLVNNAAGSGTGDGDVIVAGGTLSGHGSIGGNVAMVRDAGATITTAFDGISDRSLAIGGNLDMKTGNAWLVDLVQNIDGASSRIDVAGTLLMMAGTDLSFNFSGAFTPDHVYTVATYGSLSGRFSHNGSLWEDDTEMLVGGNLYLINYDDGNAITLTAVPEPGTWLAMALVSAFGVFARKRRAIRARRSGGE